MKQRDKIRAIRRKKSVRKKISGTAERPRLCVHKSNRNLYAQIVDDVAGRTLCSFSTEAESIRTKSKTETRNNTKFAAMLGEELAKVASPKGIKKVVFDRSGYRYHGVVKAFAESLRKNGLEF